MQRISYLLHVYLAHAEVTPDERQAACPRIDRHYVCARDTQAEAVLEATALLRSTHVQASYQDDDPFSEQNIYPMSMVQRLSITPVLSIYSDKEALSTPSQDEQGL